MSCHESLVLQVGKNDLEGFDKVLPLIQTGFSFLDQRPYPYALSFAEFFEHTVFVLAECHEIGVFHDGNGLIEGLDDLLTGIMIILVLSEIISGFLELANGVVVGPRFFRQRQDKFQIFDVVKLDEVGNGEGRNLFPFCQAITPDSTCPGKLSQPLWINNPAGMFLKLAPTLVFW